MSIYTSTRARYFNSTLKIISYNNIFCGGTFIIFLIKKKYSMNSQLPLYQLGYRESNYLICRRIQDCPKCSYLVDISPPSLPLQACPIQGALVPRGGYSRGSNGVSKVDAAIPPELYHGDCCSL